MSRVLIGLITGVMFISAAFSAFAGKIELSGAGSTSLYPLFSKMFDVYRKQHDVKINYQSIGSGGGVRQIFNKTVDFAASGGFMSDETLNKANAEILHIPICLGSVVITYNLPGNPQLKFTPEIIADIYLGKITSWRNRKLKKINPEINLPDMRIIVVHRSDASGTTFIFTDYLSKISKKWKNNVGRGKSLHWPLPPSAEGNAGVAEMVKMIPGSIGYVKQAYATQSKMSIGSIRNKSGNFIQPTLESKSLAANVELPDDARVSITDTVAPQGYPISSFKWILVYKEQAYNSRSKEKAETLSDLLWWMTHQGQVFAKPLGYAPLSEKARNKAEIIIKSITYNSGPIWKK